MDDIYASTPLFVILRVLLTVAMARSWRIRLGDVSTAFLHAPLGNQHVYIWPPKEYYPEAYYTMASQEGNVRTTLQSEKRGKTTLLQACRILVFDVYSQRQMSTQTSPMTSTSWSMSTTSWSLEILQR